MKLESTLRPLAACLLLSGCAIGADFHRPVLQTPAAYKENADWKAATPRDDVPKGAWWEVYGDPVLNDLQQQLAAANQDIAAAEARYRESLALVQVARSSLFPTLSADASATRAKSASGRATTSTGTTATTSGSISNNYNLSADAAWEVDLWGRIRRNLESSRATAAASGADLVNTRLSAQALLAQDYFQLRAYDAERKLLDDTVEGYQRSLEVTQNRYKMGVAARADVLQAETQLKSTQSQALAIGVQRAQMEHAIAVLVGKPASEFSLAVSPLALDTPVPVIPAGVPSALLERRPDVAAAERRAAAANAQIGVAEAAYFPTLDLSAGIGFQSSQFSKWLTAPSRYWTLGPDLAMTLLDFGARRGQVKNAEATYDENVANYRLAVLTAFQEVEDNLVALRLLESQQALQNEAVQAAEQSVTIVNNQYKAGIVAYTDVVTIQATALSNERSAIDVLNSRLAASVGLIKAIGGGWDGTSIDVSKTE